MSWIAVTGTLGAVLYLQLYPPGLADCQDARYRGDLAVNL